MAFHDGVEASHVYIIGVCILILIGTKILYNIYLHPLARFPGPKAYAISSIPIAWVQLSGKAHHSIQAAHRRYGPVVRISPNELSFISSTAWSDIYARNKGNPPLPRDRTFFNKMLVDPQTLTMASDVDHTRLRRSMNPAFSARAFREQEPIIQKNVDLLMQQLKSRAAKGLSTDMRTWYNYTTFDLIGDLAFGESFGCLATSAYHEWVEFVLSHFYTSTLLQVAHRFRPFNRILVALLPASMMERRVKHDEMTLKKVRRRLDSKAERQDFISQMLDSVDSGSMSIQELEKQASILILAGSETTSVALTFATYYLLHNNSCLVKLTDEIRQSFQKESEIDLLSVNRLQFLQAVIQEAMRLRPPIANGFPRETPAGGATVDGQFVPGQTSVNVHHWSAYHSPQNFALPDEFIPERWLGDDRCENDVKTVFNPFSVGPRNCIGQRFAYDSMKLILARMIWRFDMTLTDESQQWLHKQPAYVSWHQPPLMVNLRVHEV